jgi:hypothetical protein
MKREISLFCASTILIIASELADGVGEKWYSR